MAASAAPAAGDKRCVRGRGACATLLRSCPAALHGSAARPCSGASSKHGSAGARQLPGGGAAVSGGSSQPGAERRMRVPALPTSSPSPGKSVAVMGAWVDTARTASPLLLLGPPACRPRSTVDAIALRIPIPLPAVTPREALDEGKGWTAGGVAVGAGWGGGRDGGGGSGRRTGDPGCRPMGLAWRRRRCQLSVGVLSAAGGQLDGLRRVPLLDGPLTSLLGPSAASTSPCTAGALTCAPTRRAFQGCMESP